MLHVLVLNSLPLVCVSNVSDILPHNYECLVNLQWNICLCRVMQVEIIVPVLSDPYSLPETIVITSRIISSHEPTGCLYHILHVSPLSLVVMVLNISEFCYSTSVTQFMVVHGGSEDISHSLVFLSFCTF